MGVIDSTLPKLGDLEKANLAIANASQQSAKGIKTNTKEADEMPRQQRSRAAASQGCKEQENLNKMVGASALSAVH